ncbi:hypothetical protein ABEF95_008381 [Exophiala dermatitidis]
MERPSVTAPKPPDHVIGPSRQRATVACIVCKNRKIRCSGVAPCETCVSLNTRCVIDETLDGRRKVALSRRLEELIHHKSILDGLRTCLQFSRGPALIDVLEKVSLDVPLPSLAASILTSLTHTPVPEEVERHVWQLKQQLEQYMEDGREDRATSCDSKSDKSGAGAAPAAGNQRPYVDGNSPPRRRKVQSPREWESPREAMVEGSQYWPLQHEGISHSYERQTPFQWFSADAGTASDGFESGIGLDKVLQWLYSQVRDKMPVTNFVGAHPPSALRLRQVEESQPSTSTSTSTSFTTLVRRESHVPNRDLDSPTSQDRKRPLSAVSTPASQAFPPPTFFGASDHVIPDTKTSRAVSSTSTSTPTPTPNRPSSHATYSQTYESFLSQHRVSDSSNRHMARHISLPQIELDDEPMACAIVSYLDLARSMLSEGASVHEVFGPRRPMVDLLFRSRRETDPHSVCYFACELTSGLEGMEPAARLGLTFMFISLIRWMILCSSANYDDIPELYRPTPMQMSIPHSAAVEFCPFPHIRDALCRQYRDFLPVLAGNISCNWPYKFDMCVERLDGTGHVVLTDAFVRHVLVPENWTVKSAIFDTFPECRGLIKTSAPAPA